MTRAPGIDSDPGYPAEPEERRAETEDRPTVVTKGVTRSMVPRPHGARRA